MRSGVAEYLATAATCNIIVHAAATLQRAPLLLFHATSNAALRKASLLVQW